MCWVWRVVVHTRWHLMNGTPFVVRGIAPLLFHLLFAAMVWRVVRYTHCCYCMVLGDVGAGLVSAAFGFFLGVS